MDLNDRYWHLKILNDTERYVINDTQLYWKIVNCSNDT
jgi:hypothetical protein